MKQLHTITPLTNECYKRGFNVDLPQPEDSMDVPIKLNECELEGFNGCTAFTIGVPDASAAALIDVINSYENKKYVQFVIRGACEAQFLLRNLERLCQELRDAGVTPFKYENELAEAYAESLN